jgi:hypothetical protein
MGDMWTEYLGTLNAGLADYARGLRARCRTGIISNSFVGARWRERERYHLENLAYQWFRCMTSSSGRRGAGRNVSPV